MDVHFHAVLIFSRPTDVPGFFAFGESSVTSPFLLSEVLFADHVLRPVVNAVSSAISTLTAENTDASFLMVIEMGMLGVDFSPSVTVISAVRVAVLLVPKSCAADLSTVNVTPVPSASAVHVMALFSIVSSFSLTLFSAYAGVSLLPYGLPYCVLMAAPTCIVVAFFESSVPYLYGT